MKLKPFQRVPVLIAFSLILLFCAIASLRLDLLERLELVTYDLRVRQAAHLAPAAADKFGFVVMDEDSISKVWNGSLGYRFGLYWPRQIYGRLVSELTLQGAKAIGLDVIFAELRPDHARVVLQDGSDMESDEFFGAQMRQCSNVILALTKEITPPSMFVTNALALGDITTDKDADGILRRVKAFRTYRRWHAAFRQVEADPGYGVDLRKAIVRPGEVVLPRGKEEPIRIPLDAEGCFQVSAFWGDNLPAGMSKTAKPFTEQRAWHMGVVLAAESLGLDLSRAEVDLPKGRITLPGAGGLTRVLPVDREGYFYIDWCLPENDPRLLRAPVQEILAQNRARGEGKTNDLGNRWQGRLVVVGSGAVVGNDLTDRGATPLHRDALLVAKHWNVANSIITGRFVRRAPLGVELAAITLLGLLAALLSSRLKAKFAVAAVSLCTVGYVAAVFFLYFQTRYWAPVVLPVLGAFAMCLCLVAWRVVFEEAERRRIRSIFSKMVSPKIVNELLSAETLSLGGARCEITVFFADVRGFTELTDTSQERAADFIRRRNLSGPAAEACFDEQARQTLETVNMYLGRVADVIIKNDGTLDKFIGDCVMAFWGAPTPNPRHATLCVQAAIQAQRAVYELNREREKENQKREAENLLAVAAGREPQPLLSLLTLGSGINTGLAAAGLMGSAEAESLSYTVFGREVNLASRLEGASGRGRIFISETTYNHLLRDDPALAATCIPLEPLKVKGFRLPVSVYNVPWRPPDAPAAAIDTTGLTVDESSVTGFIQRSTS